MLIYSTINMWSHLMYVCIALLAVLSACHWAFASYDKEHEVTPFQTPWYVEVRAFGEFGENTCPGTLISNKVVLTAASCKGPTAEATHVIYFGGILANGSDAVEKIATTLFITHPAYWTGSNVFDVALVVLNRAAPTNQHIRPIAWNRDPSLPTDCEQTHVILNEHWENGLSARMQAPAFVVNKRRCETRFGMLDGKWGEQGVCVEIVRPSKQCWRQRRGHGLMLGNLMVLGVNDAGEECGNRQTMGAFIATSALVDWIDKWMNMTH